MQKYTNEISLVKNSRGIWDLDPFKGCEYGMKNCKNGCYGICYAAKIAKFRGFDFSKTVYRNFKDNKQIKRIGKKLQQTSMFNYHPSFVRLGVMCDPSYDWQHTLNIIDKIKKYNTKIVIITKHWIEFKNNQLNQLKDFYINTSISALDNPKQIEHRLYWYNKLKKYCYSILRVNTADFNDIKLKKIQDKLLDNEYVIDNILRFPKNHKLVKNKTINVKKYKFLGGHTYASKHNENIFFGYCDKCPDKCGINLFDKKTQ